MHGQKQSPAMVVLFPPPPMAPITPWIMNSVCWSVSPPARFSWAPPIIPAIKSLKPPANTPVVQRLPQEVLRLESVPRWPSCSSWTMRRTCWEDSASTSLGWVPDSWAGGEGAWLAVCTRQEFGGRMHLETLHASTKRAMPCRKGPGWQRRGSSSCSSPPRFRYGEGAGRTS